MSEVANVPGQEPLNTAVGVSSAPAVSKFVGSPRLCTFSTNYTFPSCNTRQHSVTYSSIW